MTPEESIIKNTKSWVEQIVIGLNFCPFASKPFFNNSIRYSVALDSNPKVILQTLEKELAILQGSKSIETSLLLIPYGYDDFYSFLDLLDAATAQINELGLEGEFQLANFHPLYQFAGTNINSPENFTNRAPYPTFHLIREASLELAIAAYGDVAQIPIDNIDKCNELGNAYFIGKLKEIMNYHTDKN